jgi:hypothetical protein
METTEKQIEWTKDNLFGKKGERRKIGAETTRDTIDSEYATTLVGRGIAKYATAN